MKEMEISSERVDDIPLIVEMLKQMEMFITETNGSLNVGFIVSNVVSYLLYLSISKIKTGLLV
jgi:hypothetical protein